MQAHDAPIILPRACQDFPLSLYHKAFPQMQSGAPGKHRLIPVALSLLIIPSVMSATSLPLIGEEAIGDIDAYASELESEAQGILGSPVSDWDSVGSYDHGLQVYSRPVTDSKVGDAVIYSKISLLQ